MLYTEMLYLLMCVWLNWTFCGCRINMALSKWLYHQMVKKLNQQLVPQMLRPLSPTSEQLYIHIKLGSIGLGVCTQRLPTSGSGFQQAGCQRTPTSSIVGLFHWPVAWDKLWDLEFIPCPSRRLLLCMSTTRRLLGMGSSDPLNHQPPQASLAWPKRMEVYCWFWLHRTKSSHQKIPLPPAFCVWTYMVHVFLWSWTWKVHTILSVSGKRMTAFFMPTGHYGYWVMLYGLASTSPVFQSLISEVVYQGTILNPMARWTDLTRSSGNYLCSYCMNYKNDCCR